MRNQARSIASLIIKANSQHDKRAALTELRDRCEEMKFLITFGKEVKAFTNYKQFQAAAVLAVDLSRQSEGRLGSQKGKRPESSAK